MLVIVQGHFFAWFVSATEILDPLSGSGSHNYFLASVQMADFCFNCHSIQMALKINLTGHLSLCHSLLPLFVKN